MGSYGALPITPHHSPSIPLIPQQNPVNNPQKKSVGPYDPTLLCVAMMSITPPDGKCAQRR